MSSDPCPPSSKTWTVSCRPTGRPSQGSPSRADSQAYDLLPLIERFAWGFDDLPPLIPGRPEYRVLIATGRLVPVISAVGQLAPDGAVELVHFNLDLAGPWGSDDDEP